MNLGAFIPGLYGYLVIDITGNRWLGHQGGGKVCLHVIDTKRSAGIREVDAYLLRFLGLETDNSFIADSCRRIHGLCRNPFTLLLEFDIERRTRCPNGIYSCMTKRFTSVGWG